MNDSNRHIDKETLAHLVDVRVRNAQLEAEVEKLQGIIESQKRLLEEMAGEVEVKAQGNDNAGVSKYKGTLHDHGTSAGIL